MEWRDRLGNLAREINSFEIKCLVNANLLDLCGVDICFAVAGLHALLFVGF